MGSTSVNLQSFIPDLKEEDRRIFRAACLLHDIGHAPFSHFGEEAKLFQNGLDHELMGENIIRNSQLGKLIKKTFGDEGIERVVFIIKGSEGKPISGLDILLADILTGQAGIDRMDYLIRDSHHTGVAYGKCDLPRLLETMRYDEENNLYWERGGMHALEQFILSRYFMFKDVYFHKTRRILDYHLGYITKRYLMEKEGQEYLPIDVPSYVRLTDNDILAYMYKDDEAKKIFIDRKFYRLIGWESSDHPGDAELLKWDWLGEHLHNKYGVDIYIDRAQNSPYKFEKTDRISVQFGEKVIPLQEASQLVAGLTQLQMIRVYAKSEIRVEVNKFVKEFFKDKEKKGD